MQDRRNMTSSLGASSMAQALWNDGRSRGDRLRDAVGRTPLKRLAIFQMMHQVHAFQQATVETLNGLNKRR